MAPRRAQPLPRVGQGRGSWDELGRDVFTALLFAAAN